MTTLESFNRLNNIRTLRVLLREEITTQDLEEFKDKILLVLEEKKEEEKMIAEQQRQQQEKLEEVKQILEQKGLTTEDLSAFLNITEVKEKKEKKLNQNTNSWTKMEMKNFGQGKEEHLKNCRVKI